MREIVVVLGFMVGMAIVPLMLATTVWIVTLGSFGLIAVMHSPWMVAITIIMTIMGLLVGLSMVTDE